MFALVDCNNFFVSCERIFQPYLNGKAVVVLSNNDGCVVARSNESKAMGIKMGTPYFQIKHYVEQGRLTVRSSNYALYGDISARIMSILAEAIPQIEVYSIDEAFLHLEGIEPGKAINLCHELVRKIWKWVGVPVSIGIAPTKTLAKIASHFAKTHKGYKGVCAIDNENKRLKALELTPIADVWGIGRKLAVKMIESNISTALDYVNSPRKWIMDTFHINGIRIWEELQGNACIDQESNDRRKSICTSRSFDEMVSDPGELSLRVSDFAAMCASKLRSENSAAHQVTTFLYTNRFREDLQQDFPSVTIRLEVAANNNQEIVTAALKGLKLIWKDGFKYKKAGVIVSDIIDAGSIQGMIFDFDEENRAKNDRISKVIDMVNARSGQTSLLRLATQRAGHYSDGIKCEHRSARYSTCIDEIIEIKCR